MFQTFDESADGARGPERLTLLRREMAGAGLDGFLVPRADAHQGEYVADCDARLAWLTGFTGSAGFCAALAGSAGVFVDSRYRVQVRQQVDAAFARVAWPETGLGAWLRGQLASGGRIGFDPWLHTLEQMRGLRGDLDGSGIEMVPCANPIDRIWTDRPAPPAAPAFAYPAALAGMAADEKRRICARTLREAGQAAAILTLPDSICWLLNIRGADIPRNPVVQAFAILHSDARVDLFAAPGKLAALDLGPDIGIAPPEDFAAALGGLGGTVRIDPASAAVEVARMLGNGGAEIAEARDPCALPKARKTRAEIDATTEAHLRDGAAMCEFLCWLDTNAPGELTEIDVVRALERHRRDTGALRDISFDTICGAGPNGAIVHYRVTHETNRALGADDILLIDSGAQYLDGTTDITRTIALGAPPEDARVAFTQVLRGMIAMSRLRFPRGLAGRDIDAIARHPLWAAGRDYGHGTGHGVGVYLNVHEGPAGLSRRASVPLEPGMILSNEPGYYREGAFGIRIENLLVVREAADLPGGDAGDMLDFDTLTLVPIDRRMLCTDRMDAAEIAWLDAYHARCRDRIGPRLGKAAKLWLDAATASLATG